MKLIPPELLYKIKLVSDELEAAKKEVIQTNFNTPNFVKSNKDIIDVTSWVKQVFFDNARYK
tara:strand:+ start:562 stop:747 length:186 start_codon:yes stop_codon:yes gene_type:complete